MTVKGIILEHPQPVATFEHLQHIFLRQKLILHTVHLSSPILIWVDICCTILDTQFRLLWNSNRELLDLQSGNQHYISVPARWKQQLLLIHSVYREETACCLLFYTAGGYAVEKYICVQIKGQTLLKQRRNRKVAETFTPICWQCKQIGGIIMYIRRMANHW